MSNTDWGSARIAHNFIQQADAADAMVSQLRKGLMTTVTGRVIDSGPDWVMIQQDWQGGVLESTRVLDIDFAALERRLLAYSLSPAQSIFDTVFPPCDVFSSDWMYSGPATLPQEVINRRPQPTAADIQHASFYGDSRQAQPWSRAVRAARDPVSAVPNRGPRRQRW